VEEKIDIQKSEKEGGELCSPMGGRRKGEREALKKKKSFEKKNQTLNSFQAWKQTRKRKLRKREKKG